MSLIWPSLPREWSLTRLDRVSDVRARIGWKALTADEYVEEGYPFLSTKNLRGDSLDLDDVNYITAFRFEESPELKIINGDVLISKDGTLGVTAVVKDLPRPATVNGSIAVVRPFSIDSRFLRYVLDSDVIQGMILAFKSGMGVPHLFQADLRKFPVMLPPSRLQMAIADFLDAETSRIDALIVKKQRILGLLEERMVSLSHEMITGAWGDFGARRRTQDWLGPIPADWPLAPVGSQFSVVLGRMLNPERVSGEDLKPYVRNANVRWDFVDVTDIAEMKFPIDERAKYVLKNGDLLINEGGAGVGRSAIWREELSECYFQKSVLRLRPFAKTRPEWMVECMRVAVAQNVLLVEGNLATIPHIPAEALRPMRFPFPPAPIQNALLARLQLERHRDQKLSKNLQVQVELLQERRRALITETVTGQLDIPEVTHGNH